MLNNSQNGHSAYHRGRDESERKSWKAGKLAYVIRYLLYDYKKQYPLYRTVWQRLDQQLRLHFISWDKGLTNKARKILWVGFIVLKFR
jgi:hypothetical protein